MRGVRIAAVVVVVTIVAAAVAVPLAMGAGIPPSNMSPPVISGSPVVGQQLSTTNGVWNGTQPIAFTYQWLRCPPVGSCLPIIGATRSSYAVVTTDLGDKLASVVYASNTYGRASAR